MLCSVLGIEGGKKTLTGVAQLVGCRPAKQNVASSLPGQGTCLGCGPGVGLL